MPTMKDSRILFSTPGGAPTDEIAEFGEEIEFLDQQPGWSKIKLVGGGLEPEGWVPTETIDQTGTAGGAPGPIDKTDFARECWLQAIYFGGNAHFLAIVAEMRSGTRDDVAGAQVGPYRLTQAQWNAASSDSGFDIKFAPKNIKNWRIQCVVAGLIAHRAQVAFEAAHPGESPTAIAFYGAWLKQIGEVTPADQAKLTTDMQTAITATRKPYVDAGNSLIDATPAPIATPASPAASAAAAAMPGATEPRVRKLLTFIGKVEAPDGPNQMFGQSGVPPQQLVAMTINQVLAFQLQYTNGGKASSAAGQYQIIRQTLAGLKASLQLTGGELYDAARQDALAVKLLVDRGLNKFIAGAISRDTFANNVAMEWASMPVVTAIVGHKGFKLSPGQSFYAGDGLNKALVKVDAFLAALS